MVTIERRSGSRLGGSSGSGASSALLVFLISLAPIAAVGQTVDTGLRPQPVERSLVCEDAAARWSIDQDAKATGWKDNGRITIGYRLDAEPFSFKRDGEEQGIVVEMCRKIAADVGVAYKLDNKEPKFVPVDAQDRFAALHRGDIDMLCDSSTLNLERMACFGHTLLTFVSGPSLAVSMTHGNVSDGDGVQVGVLEGSSTKFILHRNRTRNELSERFDLSATDIKPRPFSSYKDGFDALLGGEIPAFFADREIMLKRFYGEASVEVLDEYFSYEPYTIFTRKNDEDLIFAANQTLTRIFSSVEIHEILRKYLSVGGRTELEVSDPLRYLYILQRLPGGEFFSSE